MREQVRAQKKEAQTAAQEENTATESVPAPQQAPEVAQQTDFSEPDLQAAWQRFFDQQNLSQAEKTFAGRPVRKGKGATVLVNLRNIIEQDMLESYRDRLLAFLQRELANTEITLVVAENKKQNAPRRQLSRQEQLQLLSQRYPLLEELRQRLGLDFEQ